MVLATRTAVKQPGQRPGVRLRVAGLTPAQLREFAGGEGPPVKQALREPWLARVAVGISDRGRRESVR